LRTTFIYIDGVGLLRDLVVGRLDRRFAFGGVVVFVHGATFFTDSPADGQDRR